MPQLFFCCNIFHYVSSCIISIMLPKHMTQEIDRNRVNQLYPHDVPMTFAYLFALPFFDVHSSY